MEYATFEGQIPAGEYGAGTMDVYDRGTYELVEAKRDGGLTVRLDGERLQGEWTLVPAALDGDPRNWLLLNKSGPAEPLPAPYSPAGICPSKVAYSSGWSSVWTARRRTPRVVGRPFGTAQLLSTPPASRRRSKCSRRALCRCTTKTGGPSDGAGAPSPAGSGVRSLCRLRR